MTSFGRKLVSCFNCGYANVVNSMLSTSQSGVADLDSRPPPLLRHELSQQVFCCEHCGYCSTDLAASIPANNLGGIIASPAYQSTLIDVTMPLPYRYYLCWALINEAITDWSTAAWSYIYAAWICDDVDMDELAINNRLKAVSCIDKAEQMHSPFVTSHVLAVLIKTDLLRRAGYFEQAMQQIDSGWTLADAYEKCVLRYEQDLIVNRDRYCHSFDEIPAS